MAIQSLLEEFKSKSELMSSNSKWRFPSQLQITLVTSKNGLEIQQYLEETVQNMNIAKLRKIQVLQLPNTMENLICENNTIDLEQKGSTHFVRGSEFVELIKIREIKKDLENIFKTWLLDCDIDREHLRIIFPHSTDVHDFTYSLIKCDIAECLINPLSLPFGHRYQIQTDFCSIQLGGSGITKSIGNDVSIYELEVVACLSSSSICQSQLFGQPGRLYPTQCWHLDWEEHLINRQIYISLCKKLLERDQYLLTRLKEHFHNMNELAGYFILQSDGSELLLNAVVSAELVLPTRENVRSCTSNEKMAHEILNEMGDSLDRLPLIQEFEPSDFSSGLYSMLSRNLKHTSVSIVDHNDSYRTELN
ncbi:meiosis 1 arrest protein-like [Periplaneta americana]|uniref:meiosis 1 arrest protein-like n=1 Tax=Periplaneta americana TaxID=6978 RepID=UPI0037E9A554